MLNPSAQVYAAESSYEADLKRAVADYNRADNLESYFAKMGLESQPSFASFLKEKLSRAKKIKKPKLILRRGNRVVIKGDGTSVVLEIVDLKKGIVRFNGNPIELKANETPHSIWQKFEAAMPRTTMSFESLLIPKAEAGLLLALVFIGIAIGLTTYLVRKKMCNNVKDYSRDCRHRTQQADIQVKRGNTNELGDLLNFYDNLEDDIEGMFQVLTPQSCEHHREEALMCIKRGRREAMAAQSRAAAGEDTSAGLQNRQLNVSQQPAPPPVPQQLPVAPAVPAPGAAEDNSSPGFTQGCIGQDVNGNPTQVHPSYCENQEQNQAQ